MTPDIDQLLSDTLHGRAATVTDAPPVADNLSGGHRSRWLLVAATAVTVFAIGAGVAYLSHDDRQGTPAGDEAPSACATVLPVAWSRASDARPVSAGGLPAVPDEGAADGSVVLSTYRKAVGQTVFVRGRDGRATKLVTVPDNRITGHTSWDGRYLAVASAPKIPTDSPDTPVDDIAVLDTRRHRTVHVLTDAPTPAGWVVGRGAVVVRGGIVYWGETPSAEAETGSVLSYDIARDRYRIVARLAEYPSVQPDPRGGVTWPGSTVGHRTAPPDVPAVVDAAGDIPAYVVTDGRNWAWTFRTHDRATIDWAAAGGAGRSVLVDPVHDRRFPPSLDATAGPYVFFGLNGYGSVSYVLDTRTGAVAPTGHAEYLSAVPGRLFERTSQDAAYHEVDVTRLPELRCR